MKLVIDERAFQDLRWWASQDLRTVRRIVALIDDIQRNGNQGIGKPEPLRHALHGFWSRRITEEHRLVYRIVGDEIQVVACRRHYD